MIRHGFVGHVRNKEWIVIELGNVFLPSCRA